MEKNLIAKLKSDHQEILGLLNAFKKGRGFESTEWRDNLFKAKKLFIDHLRLEDEVLYPELMKKKESDAVAKKFFEEMNDISEQVIDFIEKYKEDHSGPDFSTDYASLTTVLEKRINAEENELFAYYQ